MSGQRDVAAAEQDELALWEASQASLDEYLGAASRDGLILPWAIAVWEQWKAAERERIKERRRS